MTWQLPYGKSKNGKADMSWMKPLSVATVVFLILTLWVTWSWLPRSGLFGTAESDAERVIRLTKPVSGELVAELSAEDDGDDLSPPPETFTRRLLQVLMEENMTISETEKFSGNDTSANKIVFADGSVLMYRSVISEDERSLVLQSWETFDGSRRFLALPAIK